MGNPEDYTLCKECGSLLQYAACQDNEGYLFCGVNCMKRYEKTIEEKVKMKEEVIKISYAIELIKCKVCGKITLPSDDKTVECDIKINKLFYKAFITIRQDCCNNFSMCNECTELFVDAISEFERCLEKRKGMYNQEVTIRDKEVE